MRGQQSGGVFSLEIIETRPGIAILRVNGNDVNNVFGNESGGHRWQRVPPTERHGRRQTSTITVATFNEVLPVTFKVSLSDLKWETMRSGGCGGQNVNKLETAVRLTHIPTGLVVKCEDERSQKRNKDLALSVLTARLYAREQEINAAKESSMRKQQVGSGQRGDKRRTIREKDGQVVDHITGQKWQYDDYVKGEW